jgi:hypothetical protein
MTPENERDADGNNKISTKDFLLAKMEAAKELLLAKIDMIDKSTKLAADSMEKRLEGMNEFRDALKDQTAKFIMTDKWDLVITNIYKEIRELRDFKAMVEGKASQLSVLITFAVSIASLVAAIIALFIK